VIRELRQQGVSLRLALELVQMARATFSRPGGGNPAEERLRARIQELAYAQPSFGYRRLTALLRRQGWRVNAKRVYGLYRHMALQKPVTKKGRLGVKRPVPFTPSETVAPGQVWAADFMEDLLTSGRKLVATWLVWYNRERSHQGLGYATLRECWEAARPGAPDNCSPPPLAGRLAKCRHVGVNPTLS